MKVYENTLTPRYEIGDHPNGRSSIQFLSWFDGSLIVEFDAREEDVLPDFEQTFSMYAENLISTEELFEDILSENIPDEVRWCKWKICTIWVEDNSDGFTDDFGSWVGIPNFRIWAEFEIEEFESED